jgi:hypothetical protein
MNPDVSFKQLSDGLDALNGGSGLHTTKVSPALSTSSSF